MIHVIKVSGPQLILAGAGTGKTTTITARIAYMVEKEGIDPAGIMRKNAMSPATSRYLRRWMQPFLSIGNWK